MTTVETNLAKFFDPAEVSPETTALEAAMAQMPALPLDIHMIRTAVKDQMAAASPDGLLYKSPRAEVVQVPESMASLRIISPLRPSGLLVHVHGGGWSFGAADEHDQILESLADQLGVAVASVKYRLAPESPYPVPLNDTCDALNYACTNAPALLGWDAFTGPVAAYAESAGANLALAATIRLRDSGKPRPAGLALFYGAYDLTGTPSMRQFGNTGLVNTDSLAYFYDLYAKGHDTRNPEISPLYADLAGLPPTQLLVGTHDPLLDDSTFLYGRLLAANVPVDLHIAPGGAHGFNHFPIPLGESGTTAAVNFLRPLLAG